MPDWKHYVRKNLPPLALGPERELEMVDEMAQHLEAVYEEALADGATEQEAYRRAAAHIKDWHLLECELIRSKRPIAHTWINRRLAAEARIESRHGKGGIGMGSLGQDLRYGVRMLLKSKAFTAIAVLSLALGIGANTALFSLVDAVLLKMLPVTKPNELVLFNWLCGQRGMQRGIDGNVSTDKATGMRTSSSFSYLAFERFRDHNESLSDVFAFAPLYELNVSFDGQPEIARGQLVSGGYYGGLGVRAGRGRTITLDDDVAGAPPVAVITHRYWERRFGQDPDVVGKTVIVNNVSFTIIGVTPPDFFGALQVGEFADLSIPFATQTQLSTTETNLAKPWVWWVRIMGRLNPGVTRQQAAASFESSFQQSAEEGWKAALARFPPRQTPAPRDVPTLRAESGSQGLTESRRAYSEPLTILLAIVGLVLLIACANVANLLLARGATRQKEIAVRLAIGASRWRLVRQLLTESVLLAILGGAAGVLFAYWGKGMLVNLRPWGAAELALDLKLDLRVLGFTLAVSLLTGLLFGLAPALRATRVDLTPALKDNARSVAGGSRSYLTKSLIVAQVAMSLVLLVGAGLFVRTLRNLQNVNVGFNRENLLLFNVEPGLNGYSKPQIAQLYRRLTERLEATPGVRSATVSLIPLLAGYGRTSTISVQGHTSQPGDEDDAKVNTVGESFFETMEIPLLLGRALNSHDDERASKVAVINQMMARKYFGDENPLGRRFGLGGPETSGQIEIVGVARDAKYTDMRRETEPTAYLPYPQSIPSSATLIVRSSGNPTAITASIRDAVREVDSNLPIFAVKTQSQQADESLVQERLFATLSSFFGVLALLLACIGLYGVMSYGVARRTNEIGIRMALGATAPLVTRMVMRETMLVVGIGVAIGLGAAVATTRLVAAMLFGLAPTDPVTISFAVLLMIGVAALAGYIPARRAARVDPMIALRYE
ncbi:MAG TPA: ABC transporter permease [Blastocatellia bacterium]|nr:ABC transporter permease [Blastocatellia bacterium]